MTTSPVAFIQGTPVMATPPPPGIVVPTDGLGFDAGYPLTFPSGPTSDLASLFPTIMPEVERAIWNAVNDSCSSRWPFSSEGQGMVLPTAFAVPADLGLYEGRGPGYPMPDGSDMPAIPVVRGWPAYPGKVPAIGVAETNRAPDTTDQACDSGFASDVFAIDPLGNVVATAAYYAEPQIVTVIVELIHVNRDERDRLHDQLHRVLYPLRRILPGGSSQIKEVSISDEKQDLPIPEQPDVIYVSLFTVQVHGEALIPTEISVAPGAVITQLDVSVTTIPPTPPTSLEASVIDLT